MKRSCVLRGTILFLFVAVVAGGALAVAATDEGMQRRMEALPHVARGYLRQYRPTVVPPTLAPLSEEAREAQRALLLADGPGPAQVLEPAAPPPTFTPVPTSTPQAEDARAATPTVGPTSTPTATPSPSATPYPVTPVAAEAEIVVDHTAQMWNNCGPATLTMNFSHLGLEMHQREAARFLKPNGDDKNVSPEQLAALAEAQGFEARIRMGGDLALLRRFLSNGFPVIVERWLLPEDHGGMGHYSLLTGYRLEEAPRTVVEGAEEVVAAPREVFLAEDSYFGPDRVIPAAELVAGWRIFNYKYIVVYRPAEREWVDALLGPWVDDEYMRAQVLATAQADAAANPEDGFAWHNVGSAYTAVGDYERAAAAFDEARRLGLPLRMFWYQFDLFEAYLAMERYQDLIDIGYATAYSASGHEEAYYYQALGFYGRGEIGMAVSYLRKALGYNPNFAPAAATFEEWAE